MPIQQAPMQCHCPKCGWTEQIRAFGDVLLSSIPETCPECAYTPLHCETTGLFSRLGATIGNLFSTPDSVSRSDLSAKKSGKNHDHKA